jgi:GH15 family glucan-1,4-alpha-glucosidase
MCWAGADRMASITQRHHPARADEFRAAATKIHEQIMQRAWCGVRNGFASTYGGQDMDAALLQMATLRFLPHDDPRLTSTVDAIESALSDHGWLFRYRNDDGLGATEVAFVICTFWLVEALATTGRTQAARTMMDRAQQALTSLGLIAEDYGTSTRRMSGNFPQAYSHVGLIHAAFAASPRWRDVL